MAEQVRVGVVGTSWWADLMFLPSLKSHPRARIAAICGRNQERAEEIARKYEIEQVYTDYMDMIERANLDALVISTPDDLHYPITMAALDAGLHVLCEKPLALNARDAQAMAKGAERAGVKHMVHYTFRWMPYYLYLRQLIEEGYIGRCYDAHFSFISGYGRGSGYTWRYDQRHSNGALGDLGSHMIDMARWMVGEISAVSAQLASFIARERTDGKPFEPVNDSAILGVAFQDGAQGVIHASSVAHRGAREFEQLVVLHGESGTLEVTVHRAGPEAGATIRGMRSGEQAFQLLPVPEELWGVADRQDMFSPTSSVFINQMAGSRLFIDAIVNDRPLTPNFNDGLKAQQVVDAALRSWESGCWTTVES